MGIHARIENGFISIDTTTWLDQRTAGPLKDLTRDLHAWAARQPHRTTALTPVPGATSSGATSSGATSSGATASGATAPAAAGAASCGSTRPAGVDTDGVARWGRSRWQQAVLAWCTARGYGSPDRTDPLAGPELIVHESSRLDRDLWVARTVGPHGLPIVVVQVEDDAPFIRADGTREAADWYDGDTVAIVCPNGHGWWWRTGRELVTADGSFTTLTVVFGPNLDAPFTRCGDCLAHDLGRRPRPCGCDGTPWIVCPVCGARCDVELPVP